MKDLQQRFSVDDFSNLQPHSQPDAVTRWPVYCAAMYDTVDNDARSSDAVQLPQPITARVALHWSLAGQWPSYKTAASVIVRTVRTLPLMCQRDDPRPAAGLTGDGGGRAGSSRERKCADTTGTVLVPSVGHFQC